MTIEKTTKTRWKQQESVNIHKRARKWTEVQKEHKQEDRELCSVIRQHGGNINW
jgi:hypothetical protein